jgi:hypothetical protein
MRNVATYAPPPSLQRQFPSPPSGSPSSQLNVSHQTSAVLARPWIVRPGASTAIRDGPTAYPAGPADSAYSRPVLRQTRALPDGGFERAKLRAGAALPP